MKKIYSILNQLVEQPFFLKLVEIAKFFKLQKSYWSVATPLIVFLIGQMIGLITSNNIEKITQEQIQSETITFIEKVFWYFIEIIFASGAWWALSLGFILLVFVSLIRYYEIKHSKSASIDSIFYNKFFESFDFYKHEIESYSGNIEYVNDKDRVDYIIQIRNEIENILSARKSVFIRVEGFSGIGKTRFVYEALNDEKYKKFVHYIQSRQDSTLADLKIFCKKLPENSQEIVIFVIDECPYDNHVQICRQLKNTSNLLVITIDQVLSRQDKTNCLDEQRIVLKGLEEQERIKLIQKVNPVLPEDIAKKIAYYTEGYPRLAKFMAESYDIKKGDTKDPDEKSRLLTEIIDKFTTNSDEIKILQAISIFKMFPNSDEYREYKKIIFEYFNIDNASSSITIKSFIQKGIVREAGRFLYISPRPISIHLFNQFLENDYDFIDGLFQKLNNEGLMNSFFEKLQSIQFDTSQHKDLLFQILSRLTYEQIIEGFGSKIFYTLCLKDRKYSICILNKLLKGKTKEDLLKLEDGRRYLVYALEMLIANKDTFVDSAKILFQLARAENESWGNNATGIFKETFQWILGGTEVNIVKRLELLKNLYEEYKSEEDRLILLKALKTSYPQDRYMATHKDHANFPEHIPEHYYPQKQEEIDEYFEKLKELISFMYKNSSSKLQSNILNDLVHAIRTMMQYEQINVWMLDFIEKALAEYSHLKTSFYEQISMIIKYDKDEKLSENISERLEKLYNEMTNPDNINNIKELFFNTDEYRYNSEEIFEKHCGVVAQDILKSKNFDGLLDKTTSNLWSLGKKLADLDQENSLYEDIIKLIPALTKDSNDRFILAYIFNSSMGIIKNYESLFKEIYSKLSDKSLMFEFIHYSKPTEISFRNLYLLLENKEIESSILENLIYGFWLRDTDKNEFINFMDKINSIIENKCDSFAICMQYVHQKRDKELLEKYTTYYIQNDIFKYSNIHRVAHDIDNMMDDYFSNNFEMKEPLLTKIWDAILNELDNEGKFEDGGFRSIYKIIQKYPDFFWEKIKNKLDELKPATYPLYSRFVDFMQGGYMSRWFNHSIFSYIQSDDVISWLKITDYTKAKYIVAKSLNIDFEIDTLPEIVIELLSVYPYDEDLYNSIKVSSEGWSGSYVPIANKKIENIEKMLKLYKDNERVLEFLQWAKKGFESRRDWEQNRDEEENLLY